MASNAQVMNSSELRNRFGRIIDDALRGRTTIVERFGRPAAAFVPIEVYERYLAMVEREEDAARAASHEG